MPAGRGAAQPAGTSTGVLYPAGREVVSDFELTLKPEEASRFHRAGSNEISIYQEGTKLHEDT